MIWDNNSGQKLADAANCHYSDIGYTGFEELYTIPYDTTVVRGNFSFHKGYIESGTGMSGYGKNKCFHLTPATLGPDGDISGTQNLQAGRTYKLSFWVKGTAPALKVGNASITLAPAQIVHTTGNWHNYQLEFTPAATGKLNFAASGGSTSTYIDEIRLCPAGAQMQSRTYEPLFGLSSETGASGRITSYEYDKFGRRTIVRDQDGNILSKTQFQLGATGL
jgi:YD repeat-containing protein